MTRAFRNGSGKLRVLFVSYYIDDPSVPGFGPKYEKLSERWEGDVFHLTREDVDYKAGDFTFRGCRYLRSNVFARQWHYLRFCLRRAGELEPYDVIISYDPMICGFISMFLKRRLKVRLLIEVNTDHFFRLPSESGGFKDRVTRLVKKAMMRLSFSQADAVKFINTRLADEYRPRFHMAENRPLQDVFFSYIATQAFEPEQASDGRSILMVGHPFVIKGADVLLKAFNRIAPDYPDVQLKIIGMCHNLQDYEALVDDPSRVTFLPGVPHSEIAEHFRQCLFYVLSSRTEGIPRVLIEAMACGKAVVGSRVGGVPDVIADGETGLLFESENDADLAEKMRLLLDDPDLRARYGEAGLKRSREVFSPEVYVNRYFQFMDRVVGNEPGAA